MFIDLLIKTIVFLLPTQLGFHFWPSFSRVAGIKIDYLSPTLYFLDLLLLLLIFLSLPLIIKFFKKHLFSSLVFFLFIILNTTFSISPLNTLFWWLRTLLYLFTFVSLKERRISWCQIETPLLCSTLFLLLIQLFQTLTQSSLGRFLYLFGERAYSTSTPGLARLNLFGLDFVRAPATFSHPNSLAGYLLIVYYLFSRKASHFWYRLVPFFGLLLTLSKTSIFALLLLLLNTPSAIFISFSLLASLSLPLLSHYSFHWSPLSDRLFHFSYLWPIFKAHYLLGTGLGNFVPSLGSFLPGSFLTPSKLQPIHNLYYLLFSELGLFGLITFIYIAYKEKFVKIFKSSSLIGLLGLVLLIGSFDHYLWTLPQNKLILVFALVSLL